MINHPISPFPNYQNKITVSRTYYGEHAGVVFLQRLINAFVASASIYPIGLIYGTHMEKPYYSGLSIVTFMLALGMFEAVGIYQARTRLSFQSLLRRFTLAWIIVVFELLFLGYAIKLSEVYSRKILLTWFIASPMLTLLAHEAVRFLCYRIFNLKYKTRHAIIIGINDLSRQLVETIKYNKRLGIEVDGFLDDRAKDRTGALTEGHLLGRLSELPTLTRQRKIDTIFIALPLTQQQRIIDLVDALRDTTASIYYLPNVLLFDLIQARLDDIDGVPVVALCETPFYGMKALVKRLSDIVMATFILFLLSPLMLLIAIGVKLSSPGPILFKQHRYGLDGQEILVYKFRSMTVCEDGETVTQATRSDPRTTPLGFFLRHTSLDELPQFINVLQGSMSVIGPRPHAVVHNEQYRKKIKGYMIRHKVKPGITGLAQVRGFRGETKILEEMEARVESDIEYMRNWSLTLDFQILLKTFLVLFNNEKAY
ncbi:Undecaprenyl-phosphate glucose phosphotransferase [Nitrosococcus halophilus Nc 4]|uniref:Undecaprenyl-phosphate glucose phosphotransferase n=1 Tax=Nitrosococcus halophilus (strain Nc4) TaxID=472759 RepID=D5C0L2_NITHN|nr:undecaprenyl-phosphate glucose phosphotransferase [Nitrosococcus halophilus]ADE16335.1 Undecaprenyl-phosphate glucose phosphotransferase [Nitrosococcus halophilus Nc 4]